MIFNFTNKCQFTSRLNIEDNRLEQVKQRKLLVIITDDLKWNENTKSLVNRANATLLDNLCFVYPKYSRTVSCNLA